MIIIIKILAIMICMILYLTMIKDFVKNKNQNLLFFPITFFFLFFVVPILLDIIFGYPNYSLSSRTYGFLKTHDVFSVELIYNLVVVINMIIFYKLFRRKIDHLNININIKHKDLIFAIVFFMNIFLFIYFFTTEESYIISAVLNYNTRFLAKNDLLYFLSSKGLIFCLFNIFVLFLEKNRMRFLCKSFMMYPFLIFFFLLNGKRAIIFITVFVYLMIIIFNKIIVKPSKIIILTCFLCTLLITFNTIYSKTIAKGGTDSTFQEEYTSYRINFGRDDTLKMAIYSEVYDDMKILDYRGESFVFYATFFIRRDLWKDKPYPYATYLTSSLIGLSEAKVIGWNMTTSIYDEFISNLGIFSSILIPFILNYFVIKLSNINDKKLIDIFIKVLGILIVCLSLVLQINAFNYLIIIFVLLLFLKKLKRLKKYAINV